MAKKEMSREFLEELLAQTKKEAPQWLYAAWVKAARSIAGGKAKANRARARTEEEKTCDEEEMLKKQPIEKPFPNEPAARQTDPDQYQDFRRVHEDWLPEGVDVIYGIKTEGGERVSEIQSFRFDKNALTPREVRSWLTENDFKTTIEEAAEKQEFSKALISFVVSELSPMELARQTPLVGDAGRIFKELYLDPLGIDRDDIHITIDKAEIEDVNPRLVIALGKIAKEDLGDWADFNLPHPEAIRKYGDRGEVGRKLKSIHKVLFDKYEKGSYFKDRVRLAKKEPIVEYKVDRKAVINSQIIKSAPEKRIVYAAVVDPYGSDGAQEDAHNDWMPPDEVEKMAHDYLINSRVIKMQHSTEAEGEVVESWVEQYPSREEYLKAMNGEPHRVLRKQFGDDVIHSGSWIMGVRLGEREWNLFKAGKITAFSPGGFGVRKPISKSEMPQVTFIDLKESSTDG